MTSLATIRNWFKTGLKPTQLQFYSLFDSFWHKSETIPAANIENLDNRFDEKADADAFNSHLEDLTAHGLGTVFLLIKTALAVPGGDVVIDWQTEIVPGDTRTFLAKHGSDLARIEGAYLDGGVMRGYTPNYSYTIVNGKIGVLTITEVFEGQLTII